MTQPISSHTDEDTSIMRTDRGLTIVGTRITLYDVIDSLMAGLPSQVIRERLNLTEEQMSAALDYIATHHAAVQEEYQQVLQTAEENRRYWDAYNEERFSRIASLPPRSDHAELRTRLAAWKAKQLES